MNLLENYLVNDFRLTRHFFRLLLDSRRSVTNDKKLQRVSFYNIRVVICAAGKKLRSKEWG